MDAHELHGMILKGYEFRERIGTGGFGAVYRAHQTAIGREVAIKMILPKYANHPDFIRQFEVEARVVARLEHPHIVPLYDYWRDPAGAYLSMRLLRSNLRESVKRDTWKLTDVARLLDQIASALVLVHREGIVHRDIHPRNILLDEDRNAYLSDFGIARNVFLRGVSDEDGGTQDSPEYWSPEQIRGEQVTNRTDIYSLGCVIYELISGESLVSDVTTQSEHAQKHLPIPLPTVSSGKRNIPAAVDEVLQTATAKEASNRYPTPARLAAAFRAAIPAILPSTSWQPLPEPLTGRELEVLNLMINDVSTREITERLVLTSETVRWYYRQIYRKLDVNSRQQAVERALSLKLNHPTSAASRVQVVAAEAVTPLTAIGGQHIEQENPFKGLHAFQEADAKDFFGRAALTEKLLSRLSEIGESSRLLVVVGPSGSGKSSVVRAGLIPALRGGGLLASPTPFIAEFLPGAFPIEELEAALLRVSVNALPDLFAQLSEDRRGLARAAKRLLPPDPKTELFLFIDQFEELFTLVEDESLRSHFIDLLLSAITDARSRIWVVVTLRADFYDRPLMYPRLAELVRTNSELVLPLTARELEQAIVAPVERLGMWLEAGLAATIIDDVDDQPGSLPLLEYALTELFEQRDGLMLTAAGYKASGGVAGALAARADHIYGGFDNRQQDLIQQLFLRLITLGEGVEDTRRRVLLTELTALEDSGRAEEIINVYAEYRLLTLDRDPVTRGPTVEIAHEALIREWSRLREWVLSNRDDIRMQRRLAYMADEWQHSEREISFLARGAQLMQFEAWFSGTKILLATQEREFLNVSLAHYQHEQEMEAERVGRELRLEKRSRNVLRALAAAMAIALVIAVSLTSAAIGERERAEANFARADQQRLYLEAEQAMDNGASGNVGMALALRSLKYGYTPGADAALTRASHQGVMRQELTGHQFEIYFTSYSPDGTLIATSSEGGTWLYDAETGEQLRFLPENGIVDSIAFSPDGTQMVTTGDFDSGIRLWDVATGELMQTFVDDGRVDYAEFTTDGLQIIVYKADGIQFWEVDSGRRLESIPSQIDDSGDLLIDLFFAPDGRLQYLMTDADYTRIYFVDSETGETTCVLLDSAADGPQWSLLRWTQGLPIGVLTTTDEFTAYVWDMETCTLISQFAGHSSGIYAADYDPEREIVVTGDDEGTTIAWELATGHEIRRYTGSANRIMSLDISPDGASLVTNIWNSAAVWDMTTSGEPREIITGEYDGTYFPRFSPDGESIYIGGFGNTYSRWSLSEGTLGLMMEYEQYIRTLDVSPDGRYLAISIEETRNPDFSLYLIDADTGEMIREFEGLGTVANFIDFSPDGSLIATGSFDQIARIWDVETGEQLHVLTGHTGVISSAVFSPDGQRLVTSGTDNTIRVWDTETGEALHVFESTPSAYTVFSPDGSLIASGDLEGFAHILDAETGEELHRLTGHTDIIWITNFSPDGTQLVTASWDGTARIWDVATGSLIRVLDNGSDKQLYWAEFSPDGEYVVTGSNLEDRAYIWRADLGEVIASLCSNEILDLSDVQRVQYGITDDAPVCPA
ncbi:MAG: protein kinase [Anaerolineae bacterium]|nr:protein kinase [Anaerolineae bacterium]